MPEHEPEQLAEIIRRNRDVSRLRLIWETKHLEAKTAKAEVEEAQDALNDFIRGLDEEYPLFDQPPTPPAATGLTTIERDAFAALLSVGHTEEQARNLLAAIPESAKKAAENVSTLIDLIYHAMDLARPVAEVDRNIPAPGPSPPADGLPTAPEGDSQVIEADLEKVLEAESKADREGDGFVDDWRTTPVSALDRDLDDAQRETLAYGEISTLGDLADYLAEDGFRSFSDLGGLGFNQSAKVLAAFALWWFENGDGPLPFVDDDDCPADRETTALLVDWFQRKRAGEAIPAWGKWSEFNILLEDGSTVAVTYNPGMVGRPDPRDGEFQFRGPLSSTGYYSHHTGPPERIGDTPIEMYATDFARRKAAETSAAQIKKDRREKKEAKKAEKDAATKAKAAKMLVSKSGGEFPGGLTIDPIKRSGSSPEPVYDLFLVYPIRGQRNPSYAIRATSLVLAIEYAKGRHPGDWKGRVVPDDGTAKRLGVPTKATLTPEIANDQVEADDPEPARAHPSKSGRDIPVGQSACSRCNRIRPRSVITCPECDGIEFMVNPDEPDAPAKPKRAKRATKPVGVRA